MLEIFEEVVIQAEKNTAAQDIFAPEKENPLHPNVVERKRNTRGTFLFVLTSSVA